jgi:hypothetical protein
MRWAKGTTRDRQLQTIECVRKIRGVLDSYPREVHRDALALAEAYVDVHEFLISPTKEIADG